MASVFETLNAINVNDKVEKKNGLSYLSWAYAWGEVKKKYPDANYKIYERETQYGDVNYFTDGNTCWVKTGVIINDMEHIEELPVMDFRNKSIPLDKVTSFDVNKAIQRSLTKALARHGLGLYIYAGEDLPEEDRKDGKDTMEEETIKWTKYRSELTKLGVDVRGDEFCGYINDKTKLPTQDIAQLTLPNAKKLNKVYEAVIAKKKGLDINANITTF